MVAKKKPDATVEVLEINQEEVTVNILGRTPLITNAMSQKARHELLMPRGRKTAAEKAANLKHDPMKEFKSSMYMDLTENGPARIVMPATAFKASLMSAAVDIPGAAKAQIGRLTFVEGIQIPIFGIPQLMMSVVRSSDANRTPDIRSRAIIPQWACQITISFTIPLIKQPAVLNLLSAAGRIQGVGDWRPQKGSGNYGTFRAADPADVKWNQIIDTGGREAQDEAIANPEPFDSETEELINWFWEESTRRGFKSAA